MRSRSLRILLLGLFSLWFGIIVPGHERGAIRVAGADVLDAGDGSDTCHTVKTCDHCPITGKPKETAPTPVDPSSHCAICKFIGVLDAPVMIAFDLPSTHLLAVLDPPVLESLAGIRFISMDRGRGPPCLFI